MFQSLLQPRCCSLGSVSPCFCFTHFSVSITVHYGVAVSSTRFLRGCQWTIGQHTCRCNSCLSQTPHSFKLRFNSLLFTHLITHIYPEQSFPNQTLYRCLTLFFLPFLYCRHCILCCNQNNEHVSLSFVDPTPCSCSQSSSKPIRLTQYWMMKESHRAVKGIHLVSIP